MPTTLDGLFQAVPSSTAVTKTATEISTGNSNEIKTNTISLSSFIMVMIRLSKRIYHDLLWNDIAKATMVLKDHVVLGLPYEASG